jgi:NADH-quinone oxidoreductase subunit G
VTAAGPELVRVTIDGRSVEVPKGTGLVESAAAAGIEIPVFCYEPRLGAPVGACRMCLVEVEGMPKLQAGCTLTAQDGLVVHTAATSQRSAEGQNATLEFILINHPLDCPVCDKGGECPLQDLTFRYGPGSTRMEFPKRTVEKPIPVSPTIALDRERCILCYRCTRFSEGVAEDGQLVAVNRGAHSEIATFDDEPYRGRFSGNVIELCPVGALTSTQYRFQARPWEIQDVPTVCGLCPVGCNVSATTREGKVKRILSRNHPEVDGGWICDKGRFTYPHLYADDRLRDPLRRVPMRGLEEISWNDALDEAERLLRAGGARTVVALSGSETVEVAYGLAKLVRHGLGAHNAILPEETASELAAFRLPLAAIESAELVVVVGEDAIVERAPVVELWIKAARRRGAEVVVCGPSPTQTALERCHELALPGDALGERLRRAERAVLIWSGTGDRGGAQLAALAAELGLDGRPGCGAFHMPATANGRGVAEAWSAAADADESNPDPIGLLIVSGDEAAADPGVRALAERAEAVIAITMFHGLVGGWADLVLPATSYLERDGTMMNLEGRLQRVRRAVVPPCPDEIGWLSKLAERFGVELSPYASNVFAEVSARIFGDVPFGEAGEHAPLGPRAPLNGSRPSFTPGQPVAGGAGLRLLRYRPLFSGPAVERVPELQFQRPAAEIELSHDDARRRGIANGAEVTVSTNEAALRLRARVNRRLPAGLARVADEHAGELGRHVEVAP